MNIISTINYSVKIISILLLSLDIAPLAMANPPKDTDQGVVPIDISRAGNSATIDLNVTHPIEGKPRFVLLMIKPRTPAIWNGTYPHGDTIGLYKKFDVLMNSLTGFMPIFHHPSDNQLPGPHQGFKARIIWSEKDTGKILRDEICIADTFRGGASGRVRIGYGYSLEFDGMNLPHGHYLVKVIEQENDDRFNKEFFKTGIIAGYLW